MELIIKTEGPAAELLAKIAAAKREGALMLRAELTRAEYNALVDDLEQAMGVAIRTRGPLESFEGVPIFVDGKPARVAVAAIQVPTRTPAPQTGGSNGRRR